jgi:hypothetical protein
MGWWQNVTIVFLVLFLCSSVFAEKIYPGAVHQIVINKEKVSSYSSLAKSVGLEYGKTYSYTEYADLKRKNKIGIAGNYDYLLLSTGGNEWDDTAWQAFIKQPCGWETTYYKNHDITIVDEACHDAGGAHSWAKILKLAKGRRPNLHAE